MTQGILRGSAGSIPIRSIVEFDENTPDDFTIEKQRFLRRGVVETDTTKFDTDIWTESWPVKIGTTYRTQNEISIIAPYAGYSNNECIVLNGSTASNSNILVSNDGGLSFVTSNVEIPRQASEKPIHQNGYWVIGKFNDSKVIISDDLFDTFSEIDTGLAGNIVGMYGDDNAIVVWASSGVARRTTDGGVTWSDIASLTGSGSYTSFAMTNTTWLIRESKTAWVSTNQGLTWTSYANTLSLSDVFSDETYFYQGIGNALYRSTDGVNWSDSGIQRDIDKYPVSPLNQSHEIKYINGMFVLTGSDNYEVFFSLDGLNYREYFRNGSLAGNGVSAALIESQLGVTLVFQGLHDAIELKQYAGGLEDWYSHNPDNNKLNQRTQWVKIADVSN